MQSRSKIGAKSRVFALFVLAVLGISSTALAASAASASPQISTSGVITNLDLNSGSSTAPVIATVVNSGTTYIYVAWEDNTGGHRNTYFTRSLDNGNTWDAITVFTGLKGNANVQTSAVQMVAEGQYVFLTWMQGGKTAFAGSSDYGQTFSCKGASGACIIASAASGDKLTAQALTASGSDVYVGFASVGNNSVWVAASHDAGANFATAVLVSSGAFFSHGEDELASNGQYVYAVWDLVYFSRSTDYGATWSTPMEMIPSYCIFQSPPGTCIGREPMISTTGPNVYVTFPMGGLHGGDRYNAMICVSNDYGADFLPAYNLSTGSNLVNIREVQVASYGDNVYVTSRGTAAGIKGTQQYLYVSHDDGNTWATAYNLGVLKGPENGFGGFGLDPANGVLFVQWPHGNPQQMWLSESTDNGDTWTTAQQVSTSTGGVVGMGDPNGGQGPLIAAAQGMFFMVWQDKSSGNGDIYFTSGSE